MANASPPLAPRLTLASAKRLVVKVGTRVLARDDGRVALTRLAGIVEQMADLHRAGKEVLLVSSGAVGLGRERLGLSGPLAPAQRQACAAVGQMPLMALYEQGFSRFAIVCAQLLLTRRDFGQRESYLSLRNTLASLLRSAVIPIINENDVVATEAVAGEDDAPLVGAQGFGNNDHLCALVAAKLDADLLIMLTDVDGVYAQDPREHPHAQLIREIHSAEIEDLTLGGGNAMSRGGMRSKVDAAHLAAHSGCHAVVASGLTHDNLTRVAAGEDTGTWFHARPALGARQRWIAFASAPTAKLVLDAGAVRAITEQGASLLAPGVTHIDGEFRRGDVVALCDGNGKLIARGIANYGHDDARAWMSGARPGAQRNRDALVHRDHLALAPQSTPTEG